MSRGTVGAPRSRVGARTFRDLDVWKLANELKLEVYRLTAAGPVTEDFRFRAHIRESSASTCSLIAEGFGRFRPAEFAKRITEARGELDETDNHLTDGVDRGHFKAGDIENALILVKRTRAASGRLLEYLQQTNYSDVAGLNKRSRTLASAKTPENGQNVKNASEPEEPENRRT